MARLGVTPAEFYELTPIEFYHAVREKNRGDEIHVRARYEVARYQLLHLWNMQGKQVKRALKSVKEVDKFPWDEVEQPKVQSLEEMKMQLHTIANFFNRKDKKNEHRRIDSEHRRRRYPVKGGAI